MSDLATSERTVLAESADYTVRALAPEEWETRRDELLHYPTLPNPEAAAIIVVESKATGQIVASWSAITMVMLEGLYLAPEVRTQVPVAKLLLGGMMTLLHELGIHHPLTLADDPAILAMARKAGFVPKAGTLLMLE